MIVMISARLANRWKVLKLLSYCLLLNLNTNLIVNLNINWVSRLPSQKNLCNKCLYRKIHSNTFLTNKCTSIYEMEVNRRPRACIIHHSYGCAVEKERRNQQQPHLSKMYAIVKCVKPYDGRLSKVWWMYFIYSFLPIILTF